jgi:hypothetical protein
MVSAHAQYRMFRVVHRTVIDNKHYGVPKILIHLFCNRFRSGLREAWVAHADQLGPAWTYCSIDTPSPWPRWSAATLGSMPLLCPRLAFVRRITWNVTQPSPMVASFGLSEFPRRVRLRAEPLRLPPATAQGARAEINVDDAAG